MELRREREPVRSWVKPEVRSESLFWELAQIGNAAKKASETLRSFKARAASRITVDVGSDHLHHSSFLGSML